MQLEDRVVAPAGVAPYLLAAQAIEGVDSRIEIFMPRNVQKHFQQAATVRLQDK